MRELEALLREYDRARACTDELWKDLTPDEVTWRPHENSSAIGWHLGHQAHVASSARPRSAEGCLVPARPTEKPHHRPRPQPGEWIPSLTQNFNPGAVEPPSMAPPRSSMCEHAPRPPAMRPAPHHSPPPLGLAGGRAASC
ncbi:DinB family protein [Streptomyces sp. NPDC059590]|uniref:DinB family protein n=1 Tax=Streptomyces sp. NPDC059590 TaxID=3346877 RepID=UPI00368DB2A5